jgi:hypothetical protein
MTLCPGRRTLTSHGDWNRDGVDLGPARGGCWWKHPARPWPARIAARFYRRPLKLVRGQARRFLGPEDGPPGRPDPAQDTVRLQSVGTPARVRPLSAWLRRFENLRCRRFASHSIRTFGLRVFGRSRHCPVTIGPGDSGVGNRQCGGHFGEAAAPTGNQTGNQSGMSLALIT